VESKTRQTWTGPLETKHQYLSMNYWSRLAVRTLRYCGPLPEAKLVQRGPVFDQLFDIEESYRHGQRSARLSR
jgi:hypothetical protein